MGQIRVKTRHYIRQVRYLAPAPYGVEIMTLAHVRRMPPPGYLRAPQRPAFHVLIIGSYGLATHTVDFRPYAIGRGHAAWVRPGQVQRFSEQETAAGDLVLFQPDFLIPGTQAAAIADNRFSPVGYDVPDTALDQLDRARRALRAEYALAREAAGAVDAVQGEMLRHLLSVLILRLTGASDATPPARSSAARLYEQFRDLLERDFPSAHNVDHYAAALGYSPRTVARATMAAAGQTPKQMIQERIALEAARLLAHSDLAVTSIAAKLNFRDVSNFSTFFTRQTGIAPTEFRRQQRPGTVALPRPAVC